MRFTMFVLATGVALAACKKPETTDTTAAPATPTAPATAPAAAPPADAPPTEGMAVDKVSAKLEARSGSTVTGEVTLMPEGDGVRVKATIKGGQKGMVHAAHIHQTADCSAPDAKTAGDHFNPGGHPHGLPPAEQRHLGDLGNVTIGDDGTGTVDILIKGANLKTGDANSFVGRSMIVHEKQDDGGQPTGNAGARVACAELKS